jgi:hypothetical protein
MSKSHAERFLEDESQSLEYRYRPWVVTNVMPMVQADQNVNLRRISDRCSQFDNIEHNAASLHEEQERELSPEIMQEREVQRPPPAKPAKHRIHPDLAAFVFDGILRGDSKSFEPAFETLRSTSAATHTDVSQFPTDVLVTASTVLSSGRC